MGARKAKEQKLKKRKKRTQERRAAQNKSARRNPRGITQNGLFITEAMEEHKVKGSWKDYVLFVGDSMLDAWGTYEIRRSTGPGDATVALLHKRHLAKAIGKVPAERFWSAKSRRRTCHGRKKNGGE